MTHFELTGYWMLNARMNIGIDYADEKMYNALKFYCDDVRDIINEILQFCPCRWQMYVKQMKHSQTNQIVYKFDFFHHTIIFNKLANRQRVFGNILVSPWADKDAQNKDITNFHKWNLFMKHGQLHMFEPFVDGPKDTECDPNFPNEWRPKNWREIDAEIAAQMQQRSIEQMDVDEQQYESNESDYEMIL